jgi:hypothetical protein
LRKLALPSGPVRAAAARRAALIAAALGAIAPGGALAQVTLSGRVTDSSGVPVPGCDLDLFEVQSGSKIDLTDGNDNSDASGNYSVTVSPDIYHVRMDPPASRPDLAPVQVRDVVLATSMTLDLVLPDGRHLSGRVTGPDGFPLDAVDLDLIDPITGVKAPAARDASIADGTYDLTVEPGRYDVAFSPPVGSGAGPMRVPGVDVTAGAFLDVQLPRGFRVTAVVTQPNGQGVFKADLDALDRHTRYSIPLSGDAADFSGNIAVNLPEGALDLSVTPPPGAPLAPWVMHDVALAADLDLGTIALVAGAVLSGNALAADGSPLAGADLDLFVAGSCDPYPTNGRLTDGAGAFSTRVLPGDYDVVVNPAPGSGLAPHRFPGVAVTGDLSIELRIPAGAEPAVDVTGVVIDEGGAPVGGARVRGQPEDAGTAWEALTAADGSFTARITAARYRVTVEPPAGAAGDPLTLDDLNLPCDMPREITLRTSPAVSPPAPGARGDLAGFPNPWSRGTEIRLSLGTPLPDATVAVYDLAGRRVRTLYRGAVPGGTTEIDWDGNNEAGRAVAAGIYLVSVHGSGIRSAAKVTRVLQ